MRNETFISISSQFHQEIYTYQSTGIIYKPIEISRLTQAAMAPQTVKKFWLVFVNIQHESDIAAEQLASEISHNMVKLNNTQPCLLGKLSPCTRLAYSLGPQRSILFYLAIPANANQKFTNLIIRSSRITKVHKKSPTNLIIPCDPHTLCIRAYVGCEQPNIKK